MSGGDEREPVLEEPRLEADPRPEDLLHPVDQRPPTLIYQYRDRHRQLLYPVARYEDPKDFRPWRPDGAGFVPGYPEQRVPYRLPELAGALLADPNQIIYVCEGERDADAVWAAGAAATCAAGGALAWHPDDRERYAETLQQAGVWKVRIIAHRDEAGMAYARNVAASLAGIGMASPDVEVVQTPLEAVGADAADHLAAGLGLEQLVPLALPDPEDEVDGKEWPLIRLAEVGDRPAVTPSLGGLGIIYPGKRHGLSGPPETAKTIASYCVGLSVLRGHEDGVVIVIDFEMGAYDARDLFRSLGASEEELARIIFVEPETPATQEIIRSLLELQPLLVIIDAAAGAYQLEGLDDNKRGDVERFSRTFIRRFWLAGVATITLDHVTKNPDTRGRFSIGSERKLGGVDVHLGFETVLPIRRGSRGVFKIATHKDRFGHLGRPKAATLTLVSDPQTHVIAWTFELTAPSETSAPFRPTTLMEKVSTYVEGCVDPPSGKQIAEAVKGKTPWRRLAVELLLAEGYLAEEDGPHGAKLLRSQRPYRQENEPVLAPSSPLAEEDVLAPSSPLDTSLNHAENTSSPHLAPSSPLNPVAPPRPLAPPPYRGGRGAGGEDEQAEIERLADVARDAQKEP